MKKIIPLIAMTVSLNCFAADHVTFPQELKFNSKPIDSLCFTEVNPAKKSINLKKCGIQAEKSRKITETDKDLIAKGYSGYDYSYAINANMSSNGSSYYKFIGKYKTNFIIYTLNNTGGSGQFSALEAVQRHKNIVVLSTLASGDRCNGGIINPEIANNVLKFQREITPFDFLDIVHANQKKLTAYDDLAACAACCAGVANYEIKLNKLNATIFKSIDLTEVKWNDEGNTQGKYQACFNKKFADYMHKKTTKILNATELTDVLSAFNRDCVKT